MGSFKYNVCPMQQNPDFEIKSLFELSEKCFMENE